ncbi:heparan-alpha-glucosaminide N-acetyltransferase domain-containing protein [Marinobacter fonticola]|uniref:heparan-alpha-glucosaminide N-acetyltransferase domain-containing protein n=1 Tax=Marinobacter fonticola TaxID=2603215 RepID=UPI001930F01C|nr:heparan-alpha-glucosaminide N-acetyltransferase domain-containing protein [Marinobacter fonticola]
MSQQTTTVVGALRMPPSTSPVSGRVDAIDLARGLAVALMILSHGVKGLLEYEQFPEWGIVPIHLLTKFSSTLFILVFGIALGVAFLPHVRTPEWPRKRMKLLVSGLRVFVWYKVLTFVEMFHLGEPETIIDALLYQTFPSFVEILGFYAIALMWVPFFLSLWVRMPLWARLISPLVLILIAQWLAVNFGFWGIVPLQAILVEHEDLYTWGQLSRGPLILMGLLLGEAIRYGLPRFRFRLRLVGALAGASLVLFGLFFWLAWPDTYQTLVAVAKNAGKHPPDLTFMAFSLAGALLLLALSIAGGRRLALALYPITVIGSDALKAFVFHISVIFIGFRYLLGYWHSVDYSYALTLTICLILGTALWIKVTAWAEARL